MREYNDLQKTTLQELIQKWQRRLNLMHWTIRVKWDDEPDVDDSLLQIRIQQDIHLATIRIGDFFGDHLTDSERENTVAHELIHCHAQPLYDTVHQLLGELGSQARAHMSQVAQFQLEQMVDALATSFVPLDE